MHLSIRDITELVGGQLRFGPLPPLDNMSESVERIVPTCQHASTRDVVLWCGQQGSIPSNGDCFLEEAYIRGALGVISTRPVTPWAGRFHLQIDDAHRALCELAWRHAQHATGKRVLIVDPLTPSPVYHTLCRATDQLPSELDFAVTNDSHDSMRWQIIGLDTERTHTLLHTIELPNSDWHHWFQPDVVVFTGDLKWFTGPSNLQELVTQLNRLASGARLVLPDVWLEEVLAAGWQGESTTFGLKPLSTVEGRLENGRLMGINGLPIALKACWQNAESAALATLAAAEAIGVDERDFVAKWILQGELQRRAS